MRGCGEHPAYDEGCPWCWTANMPTQMTDYRPSAEEDEYMARHYPTAMLTVEPSEERQARGKR